MQAMPCNVVMVTTVVFSLLYMYASTTHQTQAIHPINHGDDMSKKIFKTNHTCRTGNIPDNPRDSRNQHLLYRKPLRR
jgi:hypothetical protein